MSQVQHAMHQLANGVEHSMRQSGTKYSAQHALHGDLPVM